MLLLLLNQKDYHVVIALLCIPSTQSVVGLIGINRKLSLFGVKV